jgi:hypothetical protein
MECIDWVTLGLLLLGGLLLLALLTVMQFLVRLVIRIWRWFTIRYKNPRSVATRPLWTRGDRLLIDLTLDDLAASQFLRELGKATTYQTYDFDLPSIEAVEVRQTGTTSGEHLERMGRAA